MPFRRNNLIASFVAAVALTGVALTGCTAAQVLQARLSDPTQAPAVLRAVAKQQTAQRVAAAHARPSPPPATACDDKCVWVKTVAWNNAAHAAAHPAWLDQVAQCIKNHESGNYSESSHPGAGSGAYQFIPGTWRAWSARAGYPGYAYAYQAPPAVQDAVLEYTLTHGGAGNWSNRFGFDPCTQGIGG